MASNYDNSSTVASGDDVLASQYNNLRKDSLQNAGDYATATGSSNAFAISIDSQISAYDEGQVFKFKANHTIDGSATLNVNGIGAKTIKHTDGTNLDTNDIVNNQISEVIYDGTSFQLINASFENIKNGPKFDYTAGRTINGSTTPQAATIFGTPTVSNLISSENDNLTISHGNQTGLDPSADMTLEIYFKPDDTGNQSLIRKSDSGNGYRFFYDSGSNQLIFYPYISGFGAAVSYTLSSGSWVHLAVTWDNSSSSATFYENGSSIGSDSISSSRITSSGDFVIGESTNRLNGKVTQVRVWSLIRSGSEIFNNYNSDLSGSETGLEGYWKLQNESLVDETSNNNDLTNNGANWLFDHPFKTGAFIGGTKANEATKMHGFVKEDVSGGDTATLQPQGYISGLSSLDVGEKYFIDNNGNLAKTQGGNKITAGTAYKSNILSIEKDLSEF